MKCYFIYRTLLYYILHQLLQITFLPSWELTFLLTSFYSFSNLHISQCNNHFLPRYPKPLKLFSHTIFCTSHYFEKQKRNSKTYFLFMICKRHSLETKWERWQLTNWAHAKSVAMNINSPNKCSSSHEINVSMISKWLNA